MPVQFVFDNVVYIYDNVKDIFDNVENIHDIVRNKLHWHLISDTWSGNTDDIGWRQAIDGILVSIKLEKRNETSAIRYLPGAGKK